MSEQNTPHGRQSDWTEYKALVVTELKRLSDSVHDLGNLQARTSSDLAVLHGATRHIEAQLQSLTRIIKDELATKEEVSPIKRSVYGAIALFVTATVTAVIALFGRPH